MRHTDTETCPNTNAIWTAILRDLTITTQLFNSRMFIKTMNTVIYKGHTVLLGIS
jgi:hypothetical protein